MEWTTACPDWGRRLTAGESIIPPPIFQDQADQALAIFKELRVVDLPKAIWDESLGDDGEYRSPNFGECSEQWVFDFVAAIFGAYDAETGQQLIREFYLLISKKNTKSTIAAGIMLTALILCWREQEEHLILAPTKEVADNSFKPAAGMVRADDELKAMFNVQDTVRTITHRVSKASLKVVAADAETVSGKKSGRVLVDEHWLFGSRANAEAMFMEATGGQVSREEGWVIYLSTQSDEPPAGVFKEKLNYYRDVRDGRIEDKKSLGVLFEFPHEMVESKAYLDPGNFYITNPNIGRSVSAEWLADNLKKNREKADGSFQQFLAKHLNIEIGLNLRADRWAGADFWQQAPRTVLTVEELIARCDIITTGIDGGGLDDMLGLWALGRERGTSDWLSWAHAWIHPIAMERRKSEAQRYLDFAAAGDLTIVKNIGDDVEQVADIVEKIFVGGRLPEKGIGVDPVGIGAIVDALEARGIDPDKYIVGVSQGWKLSGAIKTTERRLAEGTLHHSHAPLLAWCVGNCRVEPRGNAVTITKQAAGFAKIDPVMALFNAVTLMSIVPEPDVIYADYELMTV